MSDIFHFIKGNFNRLQPFDYLLILLCVMVCAWGIYYLLNMIFSTRLNEQEKLIKIKDSYVETYKGLLETSQQENIQIKEKLKSQDHLKATLLREIEEQKKLKDNNTEFIQNLIKSIGVLYLTLENYQFLVKYLQIYANLMSRLILMYEMEKFRFIPGYNGEEQELLDNLFAISYDFEKYGMRIEKYHPASIESAMSLGKKFPKVDITDNGIIKQLKRYDKLLLQKAKNSKLIHKS